MIHKNGIKLLVMNAQPTKTELLAPAGNFEKLRIAVAYGADAVYLADRNFSLRNAADNFTLDQIEQAVSYTRQHGVRLYVACNIYPRTAEQEQLSQYLEALGRIGPDAVIIADPGVVMMTRELIPDMPIHLSTQANTTSLKAVQFWEQQGVCRVNMARELSLAEIKEIALGCNLEVEAFVHGAVCMAYSGRCLLSTFLSGRDSNRGLCSHPCRWRYHVSEELRPGQYIPVEASDRGTFIFNSRDLCMIEHVDKMIGAGIHSLKIEGRMKSVHYLAATVHTYREAIDACYDSTEGFVVQNRWKQTLASVTSRGYSTNFYLGRPGPEGINQSDTPPPVEQVFIAKVLRRIGPGRCRVLVKNKLFVDDAVSVLSPGHPVRNDRIKTIFDKEGALPAFAQPNSVVDLALDGDCYPDDLIRRSERGENDPGAENGLLPGHGI